MYSWIEMLHNSKYYFADYTSKNSPIAAQSPHIFSQFKPGAFSQNSLKRPLIDVLVLVLMAITLGNG